MIVVDASVLANALTDDGPVGRVSRAELARDVRWVMPPHAGIETFSVIRDRHLGGKLSRQRAADALDALREMSFDVVATPALLARMWQLRDNLSGYDAGYVAAAEVCGCPLLTADRRLARACGIRCEVRVV